MSESPDLFYICCKIRWFMPQLHCLCSLALHLLTQFILFFFFWQRCLFNQMHSIQENIKKKNVFVPPLHFVFLSKCWIGGLVSTSYHRQSSWADGQADALQMVLKTSLNDIPSPNSPHVEPWNLAWYQCSLTGGQLPTFHFHSCLVSEQIKIHNNSCRTSTWCSHAH